MAGGHARASLSTLLSPNGVPEPFTTTTVTTVTVTATTTATASQPTLSWPSLIRSLVVARGAYVGPVVTNIQ